MSDSSKSEPGNRKNKPGDVRRSIPKTLYFCPACPELKVWGRPGLAIICTVCRGPFEPRAQDAPR